MKKSLASPAPVKSAAPALDRGLDVIAALQTRGRLSLDEIAREVPAPKSSLLRILQTLCDRGVACRADKRYALRMRLEAYEPLDWSERIRRQLERLAGTLNVTVEWYEIHEGVARIAQRCEPSACPVKVRARVGFCRDTAHEVEAVSTLLLIYTDAPAGKAMWWYRRGDAVGLRANESKRHLNKHRNAEVVADEEYNTNGIRRMAAPILAPDRSLAGILALAECYTPKADAERPERMRALCQAKQSLQSFVEEEE